MCASTRNNYLHQRIVALSQGRVLRIYRLCRTVWELEMNLQRQSNAPNESNPTSTAKQRWSAFEHLTERYNPPALSLDERGMIKDCSKTFEKLLGFPRSDLVWKHVSRLFPQLMDVELLQAGQVNPRLKYLCHCGHCYQIKNRQGETFLSNLSFMLLEFGGRVSLKLIVNTLDEMES